MMTRARRSRRLANLSPELVGSEAIAANYQLRRCCGGAESVRWRKKQAKVDLCEWRDWANLPTELVEDIAGRLLSLDVSEYLRLRSACKPWRQCTGDPLACGGGLDRRFRPRDWITVSHCASPSSRLLINVSTGARAEVDLPDLRNHHCFGVADGLLVLCDKSTSAIRLLNPLTSALVSFPTITDVRATMLPVSAPLRAFEAFYTSEPRTEECTRIISDALKVHVPDSSAINGAAIDDSTSPPTLLLALRHQLRRIVCAKPGGLHWVSVHYGEQEELLYNNDGEIYFHTLLSFGGRCYVSTRRGDIMVVDLCGPRMVYLSREMSLSSEISACSYLIRSQDHRMIMVRYLPCVNLARDRYGPEQVFTSRNDGLPSRMEVFQVDIARRCLVPLSGIGNYAAFIGDTYTVMLSTSKFPKLAANAVYLSYILQNRRRFGIYHFKDRTISPPRELPQDALGRLSPCACHWELCDYLICDTEQGHNRANILKPCLSRVFQDPNIWI
ncbi:hypothetical protein ACP4OV_017934 [Aristida adscensionis]